MPHGVIDMAVRRLTPIECERLQGFPDNYTQIPWRNKDAEDCPDGPRYKAMGNSMAVPVMQWIGRRIQMMEDLSADIALEAAKKKARFSEYGHYGENNGPLPEGGE